MWDGTGAVPYGAMLPFSCRANPLWLSVGEAMWFMRDDTLRLRFLRHAQDKRDRLRPPPARVNARFGCCWLFSNQDDRVPR